MKIKLLLLCLAHILPVFCSKKDEAIVRWPFCEFKEGSFEKLYKHVSLRERPTSPLFCHLPFYEWHTDSSPDFEKVTSEIAYLMDVDGDFYDVIATFWSNGNFAPHGGGFQVIVNALKGVDMSKYSVTSFDNNYAGISGLFLKAKEAKDDNLIYVEVCEYSTKFREYAFISEKDFLIVWNEHIKGKVLEGKCHENDEL